MRTATLIALAGWRLDACSEAPASLRASALSPRYRLAENIGFTAVVVTELKLGQVQREVLLADMMKAAHNTALEEAPKRFQIVGVNFATNVLALTVTDRFVREILFQESITGMLIGRHQINGLADSLAHESIKCNGVRTLDYLTDYVSLAANCADDANFAGTDTASYMALLVPMAVFVLAANEHLVHFNDTHELAEIRIVHRRAESHAHIPCGLVGAASDLTLNLKRTNSLLGVKHLPENLKPRLERIFRVLKNSSTDDAETVVLAWLAEPVERPCVELVDGRIAAFRAMDNCVRPAPFHQELLARFVGREGGHQFAERHHAC
jgi:hypothetical protein